MNRRLLGGGVLLLAVAMLVIEIYGSDTQAAPPTPGKRRSIARPPSAAIGKIAFASNRHEETTDIYVALLEVTGTKIKRLTNHPARDCFPSWSPDGGRIAFMSGREDANGMDIYSMKSDGTEVTRLTHTGALDWWPRWSPQGNRIAWARCMGGGFDVFLMEPDGSSKYALTTHAADDSEPDWSPDATRIAFRSR